MKECHGFLGYIQVDVVSAEPERFLCILSDEGIEVWKVEKHDELTCRFFISRKNLHRLERIVRSKGATLKIAKKTGRYWRYSAILKRPVFMFGLLLLLWLTLWIPSRILFIQINGNTHVPAQRIIEAAEECGVFFGASRKEIRSEKVKNELLSVIPELQWAGVNTAGCVATITVRERTEKTEVSQETQVSKIVASRDGYILSGTVTRGTAMFEPGQTVREGQTLISGYTDNGLVIKAGRAEGDIQAQTSRDLKVVMPAAHHVKGKALDVRRKISVKFRKKRINLWKDSGISHDSCGRMYEEYYVTLPGGFRLPLSLCVETYMDHERMPNAESAVDAQLALAQFSRRYLKSQMVAGEIQEEDYRVAESSGAIVFSGHYVCTEMIGREQAEQIGDTNGENS